MNTISDAVQAALIYVRNEDEELSEGLNELLENIDTAYLSYPDSEGDDGSGPIGIVIR